MVSYTYEHLFNQDSIDKQFLITDGDSINLTNQDIYQESFELEEILSATRDLTYGSCNSATVKFTTSYLGELKGKTLTVSCVLDGHTDEPFVFGTYKVYEDKYTADRTKKEVVCHDALYDVINANVMSWYNSVFTSISTTVTVKQLRDSFFNHFGITQETITLDNDSETIGRTIDGETLSGSEVIRRICEMNGVFGRINRSGNFEYFYVHATNNPLYPAIDLFPDPKLFPAFDGQYDANEIGKNCTYISAKYEDYDCMPIDKMIIREDEEDAGLTFGTGTNTYIIQGNFLLFGKNSTDLTRIGNKIYTHIADGAYYRPCEIELKGNPCIEIGDGIALTTSTNDRFVSFVTHRVYKGIQAQRDTFSAEGTEYRDEEVNSIDTQLYKIQGRSNRLERTLDSTISTIENDILDGDNPLSLQSQITQNATNIEAKVSKTSPSGQTSFSWEMTDSKMEWKNNGNQIMLLNSSGLEINGKVTATSGYLGNSSQGFAIDSDDIHNGMTSLSDTTHNGIYVGTDGIALGKGNFKVTNAGSLTAKSGNIGKFSIGDGLNYASGGQTVCDIKPKTFVGGQDGLSISAKKLEIISDTYTDIFTTQGLAIYGDSYMNLTSPTLTHYASAIGSSQTFYVNSSQFYSYKPMYAPSFNQTSDRRKKKDIEKIDNEKATKFILSLKPCEFKMKEDDTKHHGFIAQEIKESMYDDWDLHKENDGTQYLSYTELIADMVATIQNLQKQIDELKGENNGK